MIIKNIHTDHFPISYLKQSYRQCLDPEHSISDCFILLGPTYPQCLLTAQHPYHLQVSCCFVALTAYTHGCLRLPSFQTNPSIARGYQATTDLLELPLIFHYNCPSVSFQMTGSPPLFLHSVILFTIRSI